MGESKEVELKVGRRSTDGIIGLLPYPPELLQLSVSYRGERSASVVLTLEQVKALKEALTQFENELQPPRETQEPWDNRERRLTERLLVSDRD